MVDSERIQNPWMASSERSPVIEICAQGNSLLLESTVRDGNEGSPPQSPPSDIKLGILERAFSAAGAAFLSAIIVNPLDVAKARPKF